MEMTRVDGGSRVELRPQAKTGSPLPVDAPVAPRDRQQAVQASKPDVQMALHNPKRAKNPSPPDVSTALWVSQQAVERQGEAERIAMKIARQNEQTERDSLKVLLTCREIARRIVSGDKVPTKDHQYLMKHDRELYARSVMMRLYKEKPRKYDRLSEDEEPSAEIAQGQGAAQGASIVDILPDVHS